MNGQLQGIVEVDVLGSEPWLQKEMGAFVVSNVSLINSIEDEYLNQVTNTIANAVRTGTRVEDLADDLEERFDVSRSRAASHAPAARAGAGGRPRRLPRSLERLRGARRARWASPPVGGD